MAFRYGLGTGADCDGAFAAVAGHLDDVPELAKALGLAPTATQAEVVAKAHRRWGNEVLSHLRGAFALLLWDTRRDRGLLAVDQLGAGSVVYRRSPASFVFATEIRDLAPLLEATPAPDERAVVMWLVDGSLSVGHTLFAGVRRLPGGHFLQLGDGASEPRRYWRPRYVRPRRAGVQEAGRELRAGLDRAVQRACDRGRPAGILLSGGLDSTCVAAIARARDERLAAYSAVFPGHPAADERRLIAERARVLGMPAAHIAFRRGGALAAGLRYVDAWKLPPASPNLFFHEPLLALARSEGIATMLDGQGGDELFGSSPYLVTDRFRSGDWVGATRLARTLLGSRNAGVPAAMRYVLREIALKGALPAWVHRAARSRTPDRYAPSWLTTEGSAIYGGGASPWDWKSLRGPRSWAHLADLVTRGRERGRVHDSLRHMLGDAGLNGAHPLLEDVDLVETALAMPPELAFDEDLDRPLLRAALADVLPDAVRLRAEKSYFNDVLGDALHVRDEAALRRLLHPGSEVARYVRADQFDRLRNVPPQRRGRRETLLLWRCAAVECWLRSQADPGFAQEALETWGLEEPRVDVVLGSRA